MGITLPTPYRIHIDDESLRDLTARLAHTRWPDEVDYADWDYGTNLAYLRSVCAYWLDGFDWRAQERKLNELPTSARRSMASGSTSSTSEGEERTRWRW